MYQSKFLPTFENSKAAACVPSYLLKLIILIFVGSKDIENRVSGNYSQ